jgi:hypothetical protein
MKSFGSAFLLSMLGAFGAAGAVFGQASTNGLEAIGPPSGVPRPSGAAASAAGQGNPLWGIPLASLHETRDRPLFSARRRPPAPIVAEAPKVSEPAPLPPRPEAEKPQFTLVGVVYGRVLDLAVFLDETDKSLVRLRVGQSVRGWTVHSLDARTATLEKAQQRVKLELPARNTETAAKALSPAEVTAAATALDQ